MITNNNVYTIFFSTFAYRNVFDHSYDIDFQPVLVTFSTLNLIGNVIEVQLLIFPI